MLNSLRLLASSRYQYLDAIVDYKATLNLPQTEFPMKADLARREPEILARWETERLYDRISVELVDDWPATRTQIRLRTGDGVREHLQDGAARPADGAECLRLAARKFNSLARPRLGAAKAERLHEMILALETQSDASELVALSSIAGGRAAAIAG